MMKIGEKEIPTSKLTYENLITLFKQFEQKENRVPSMAELTIENNLPSYSKVKSILKKENLSYKEFCSMLGANKMLFVNGIYKHPKDITYDDLVLLYQQYIDKHKIAPTSITSNIENNLPHRVVINSILKEKDMTHDEFLSLFGVMNGKRKYNPVKIGDIFGRWKVIGNGTPKNVQK